MDVIEYFKIKERLCNCNDDCAECPLHKRCTSKSISKIEESVEILEQWVKDHPIKTNLDVIAEGLEKLGYTVDRDFMRRASCPPLSSIDYAPLLNENCCLFYDDKCDECRKWWDAEWKETK